jgi:hypothetical protein
MAFVETAPAGTETTFHPHCDSDELIYVLSGEFTFKIDDQVATGGPGTCAFIPRGRACLEEHRSRTRAGAVPLHSGWGGQGVRGGEAPAAPSFVDGRSRGCRVLQALWLGDRRTFPVLSGMVAALADRICFGRKDRPSARLSGQYRLWRGYRCSPAASSRQGQAHPIPAC